MDLREVLAEVLLLDHGVTDARAEGLVSDEDYEFTREVALADADAVLARLFQPDVLDEFERRVREHLRRPWASLVSPAGAAEDARHVLSDMLGGGE